MVGVTINELLVLVTGVLLLVSLDVNNDHWGMGYKHVTKRGGGGVVYHLRSSYR